MIDTLKEIIRTVEAEGADNINVPTAYVYRIEAEHKAECDHHNRIIDNLLNTIVSLRTEVKAAFLEGWNDGANSYSPYDEETYNSTKDRDERDWDESLAKRKLESKGQL